MAIRTPTPSHWRLDTRHDRGPSTEGRAEQLAVEHVAGLDVEPPDIGASPGPGHHPQAGAVVVAPHVGEATLGRQLHRLIGADEMGELFKVCAIHSPDWTPPAFEEEAA